MLQQSLSVLKSLVTSLTQATRTPKVPVTRTIPPCENGRRLVISDIHGCHRTFEALLTAINLKKKDQLFLLGDFINRGPHSGKVIDLVLKLQSKGYQVFCLRGNHEQLVLECHKKTPYRLNGLLLQVRGRGLQNKRGKLRRKYLEFMQGLHYYFELDDFLLVHAGFNFRTDDPFHDLKPMLNIRDFWVDDYKVGHKRIIHGHDRQHIKAIRKAIDKKAQVIPIDNGCANIKNLRGHGRLVCLDLTNWRLYEQACIDFTQKKGRMVPVYR